MKFIKYLIALIALLAVAVCTGEFYQVYVYEANSGDFAAFSLDTNTDLKQFYEDVPNTADAHGVLAVCESINSIGDNSLKSPNSNVRSNCKFFIESLFK